jgi:hypothetical protein
MAWFASAALALGVSAAVPGAARADYGRDYRDSGRDYRDGDRRWDRDRHDHRVERDFDVNVSMRDVPHEVRHTIDDLRRGRAIESVQFVKRDGKYFYRFRVDARGRDDVNFRINPAGRLLSVQEVEECDRGYVASRDRNDRRW